MLKRFAGEKFNLLNPFTYGNMGKAIDDTRSGTEGVEYSDTQMGDIGRAANEKNRILRELLGN
tara:strand:- start:246 stop:434 length:189 start_codon:yes stop_codon:yes gene_type:complete